MKIFQMHQHIFWGACRVNAGELGREGFLLQGISLKRLDIPISDSAIIWSLFYRSELNCTCDWTGRPGSWLVADHASGMWIPSNWRFFFMKFERSSVSYGLRQTGSIPHRTSWSSTGRSIGQSVNYLDNARYQCLIDVGLNPALVCISANSRQCLSLRRNQPDRLYILSDIHIAKSSR